MTRLAPFGLAMVAVFLLAGTVRAEEPAAEQQTLTGQLVCGKCALKQGDSCQNMLQVKDGEHTTTYCFVDNEVSKAAHKNVCHTPAQATVTGTVSEKDGAKWITASKIDVQAPPKKG